MPLEPGSKLGVYEVTAKIGAGGMGEVYRAHDTTLDRDVAIKVLPDAFATDPERLARFEREAKVLASLNHPNIAAIYGLEKSGDTPALVLELVEGPTLQDLIGRAPAARGTSEAEERAARGGGAPRAVKNAAIPLEEALPIARQIAEALEAAHEQGIIHRDLKPANIKVKAGGRVKVLDFGLAKALQPELSDLDAANSPTMTMTAAATKMGVIMGTAAYMAPEQAKGRRVDKRADIWAFGVVLYEMLTGRQAFGGTDISETLASVLKTDLNLDTLPADTPRALRRVLSRCIQKDRSHRSRDIGDVRLDLDEALAAPGEEEETVEAAPVAQPVLWQRPIPALLAVVAVAAVSGLAVWSLMPRPDRPVTRFVLTTPPDGPLALSGSQQDLAISPDGSRVVYSSGSQDPTGRQLFIRDVAELEPVPIRGTEGGANPFFSPDGAWIGFRDARDSRLKKVSALGGPAVVICDCTANVMRGATWGPDDMVVFATTNSPGLMMVSAAGGAAEELTRSGQEGDLHIWPEYLPDGRAVLFTIWSGSEESAQVAVLSLETGAVDVLLSGGSNPHYVSTGHIVYGVGGTIRAVGFDADRLELTSDNPMPVVENVGTKTSGVGNFGVSNNGSLVYIRGSAMAGAGVTPVWVDRRGQVEEIDGVPTGRYADLSLSPDGGWLAVARGTDQDAMDIWTLDLSRRTLTRVTTAPGIDQSPLWTPDGQRIVFASNRDGGGRAGLYSKAADGTGEAELVLPPDDYSVRLVPNSWSPDGTRLVFSHAERGAFDISTLSTDDGRVDPLITTDFGEYHAAVAPGGGWVAYTSLLTGRREIYLQRFPELGERLQVSTAGGVEPLWSHDGRQLYYRWQLGRQVWAVSIDPGPPLTVGAPELLFDGPFFMIRGRLTYALSPDGERFLMLGLTGALGAEESGGAEVVLVLNWFEELQARVPTGQ